MNETNNARVAALQDISYRDGAQQALAIAHQSLKAADKWFSDLCERTREARAVLKTEPARPLDQQFEAYVAHLIGCACAAISAPEEHPSARLVQALKELREYYYGGVPPEKSQKHNDWCVCEACLIARGKKEAEESQ